MNVFEPPWERERESLFAKLDYSKINTPAYIIHLGALEDNLRILEKVKEATGCKILLALKGFAFWNTFPLIRNYLDGVCASSVYEARLGCEEFGKEVHSYSPAFSDEDIEEHFRYSNALIFNSLSQWSTYRHRARDKLICGIRINPEVSQKKPYLYNPCIPGSRLGVKCGSWIDDNELIKDLTLLHFHALCEEGPEALEKVLEHVEGKFGSLLAQVKTVNFGGGHLITRSGYDIEKLCRIINAFQERYRVEVYLEPGEAVGLNTGVLAAKVLDIIEDTEKIAILDTSAEAHMPDVLAMPYRPSIIGAGQPGELPYTYTLGGLTCLAGDVIGSYSFNRPLQIGDKLIFQNMAIYTAVKNTTFNGIQLPSIVIMNDSDTIVNTTEFDYSAYKNRLG